VASLTTTVSENKIMTTRLCRIGMIVSSCVLLAAAAEAGTIQLQWDRNAESNVAGYKVSYGTASGQYTQTVDVGNNVTASVSVTDSITYFFAVRAYDSQGTLSPYSDEVSGAAAPPVPVKSERMAFGLSKYSGNGGWLAMRNSTSSNVTTAGWAQVPWASYNKAGGATHAAAGDVDGDGLDEIIVGLGSGGEGWVAVFDDAAHNFALLKWIQLQWPTYNVANGETWPAAGDLDGDGRAEIVVGVGYGGAGWVEIFDDAAAGFAHKAWRQVAFPTYIATGSGATHPAVGNVDGTGASEIVIGLGTGGGGYVEILKGTSGSYAHQAWVQAAWPVYNAANGATFPAVGDTDGDGRAEIVLGFGAGSGGYLEVADDGTRSYAVLRWLRVSWANYNSLASGETHPAVGNIDGDTAAEIVVGLDTFAGNGGWFEILDDDVAGNKSLGWRNLDWPAFTTAGGGTFPAVGLFR
jgi:hypothetical protein